MKFLIILGFTLIASIASASSSNNSVVKKVCVLNFETPEAPQSAIVNKVLKGKSGVTIYDLARPIDLVTCIQNRSDEIMIIGHALLTPTNKDGTKPVDLGFFLNLTGDDRRLAVTDALAAISQKINLLNSQTPSVGNQQEETKQYNQLVSMQKKLMHFKDSDPYYIIRPVLPHAIFLAREELSKQASESTGISLKKIRLMSCLPDQVLAEYDDLRGLIDENNIDLDIAPKNKFWSAVEGMNVTSPNKKWLAKSLQ